MQLMQQTAEAPEQRADAPASATMRILNPRVLRDIEDATPLRLDLGCGRERREGFYGVDRVAQDDVDIVADLERPLDLLPDNSVSEIYTRHTLEHLRNVIGPLREIHRLTRPDGRIEIIVPHFSNPYYYSDPTHRTPFGLYSLYYFVDPAHQPSRKVPDFYVDFRFRVEQITIGFYRHYRFGRRLVYYFERLVNRSFDWQDWYERRVSWLYPAHELRYIIRPVK